MSSDFCVRCDKELSVYCGPCVDAVRAECDQQEAELTVLRGEAELLRAAAARLRNGMKDIRERLLEEDCDCPPEWPRCVGCRVRLRIQVLLRKDEP